ncbi:unnamed protein product [Moneuplotes crassus]|uniref:ERCC4 domain-containing protein n=1 Tax=Euplotes crassus TaxID=5936 RepID=A0AAD1XQT2_EUPCR|nr:unnamed protein product [Moneuplotes crassus]
MDSHPLFLPYEQSAAEELEKKQNCFLLAGIGMSLQRVVALYLLNKAKVSQEVGAQKDDHLIMILGAEEEDKEALRSFGVDVKNADETLVVKRNESYLKGGIFAPTSKTLVLDLLAKKLSPHIISGFVIMNADKSLKGSNAQGIHTFMSNVCFCLKIYKKDNKDGFVKVLSSNPNGLSFKGGDIKDFMKASYVDKLILYPRIRTEVKESIEECPKSNIIEAEIEMNPRMGKLHEIIIKLLHFCIEILEKELEKFDLDEDFFTPNTILSGNYNLKLKLELKNEFFDISSKARIALRDITCLKYLLNTLLESDAISFHLKLLACKETNNPNSIFLTAYEEVEALVDQMAATNLDRIYQIKPKQVDSNPFGAKWKFTNVGVLNDQNADIWAQWEMSKKNEILELNGAEEEFEGHISQDCSGKWLGIIKIFKEMNEEISTNLKLDFKPRSTKKFETDSEEDQPEKALKSVLKPKCELQMETGPKRRRVLIVAKSLSHCKDLRRYLASVFIAKEKEFKYFSNKLSFFTDNFSESVRRERILDGKNYSREQKIEAYLVHKLNFVLKQNREEFIKNIDTINFTKRRRSTESNYNTAAVIQNSQTKVEPKEESKEETKEAEQNSESKKTENEDTLGLYDDLYDFDPESFDKEKIITNGVVNVITFRNSEDLSIYLDSFNPNYIILLDPKLEYFRSIELYNARRNLEAVEDFRLKIYYFIYKDSTEKFHYLNTIQREKKAFDRIIRLQRELSLGKKMLVEVPDPLIEEREALKKLQKLNKYSTAIGGQKARDSEDLMREQIVVVDVREFSSSTPHYLYDAGFWVIPVTLNVGDFVLSNKIAVEKKAVSTFDLHQSLNSGRLLKQITFMSKFYERVILLIEFDDNINFKLKEMYTYEDNASVNPASVFSKLTLLIMNFPNIICFWSKGQKETAEIFTKIKANTENPDIERVERIGKVIRDKKANNPDLMEIIEAEEDDELRNKHLPQDFLRSLPGVSHRNITVWFKGIKNITELIKLSKKDLIDRCGDHFGKKIFDVLHWEMK